MKRLCSALLPVALCLCLSVPALGAEGQAAVCADPTAFTDAKNIQQWEAVATLSKLGVINGKPDGSFSPTAPVTRAEAAKLLFVLAHGGQDAEYAPSTFAEFSDTKGHWAEKYITWCDKLRIIAGRGDGTFDPNENVTSLELSKMALVLLGYDADAYRLNGAQWAEKVYELASMKDVKLYDGLSQEALPQENGDSYVAAPLNREDAARLLCNALNNPIKVFMGIWGVDDGSGEWVNPNNESSAPLTLLNTAFHMNKVDDLPAQPVK